MTEATSLPRPVAPADSGALEFRGLLHDLGHQMMTLSLLAEAVRNDTTLSAVSRQRIDLVMQEMFRIVDVITDCTADAGGPADGGRGASGGVDIRRLAAEVAQLAGVAYQTRVSLRPGRPAVLRVSGTLMWRVLANLVDNAVRAAGPDGTVEIRISQERDTVIEVVDDGPGFGGDLDGWRRREPVVPVHAPPQYSARRADRSDYAVLYVRGAVACAVARLSKPGQIRIAGGATPARVCEARLRLPFIAEA